MSVGEYFAGGKVLVTGATGFVGKVLVEKLLRSCPEIDSLYLLVRSKKGESPAQRWEKCANLPLFDKLKSINPNALDKIKLIESDIGEDGLGLSPNDKQFLIENTTLIYHSAASVQFNNNIITSLKQNTKSTYSLLELAKLMPQLKTFIYVSTTYTQFNRPQEEWEEEIHPAPQDWKVLLKLVQSEEPTLQVLQDKLLEEHPNTYTFTKHLAENIVNEYKEYFPVVVYRPAIVSCVESEPLPGWTDSLNGLSAICLGTSLGIVRVFLGSWDDHQDYVAVDNAASGLCLAPYVARQQGSRLFVCNATIGIDFKADIRRLVNILSPNYLIPSKFTIWPPHFTPEPNYNLYFVKLFFKMVLPYFFLDQVLKLKGEKQRLIPVMKKVAHGARLLRPFANRQIYFPNEKFYSMMHYLKDSDINEFEIRPRHGKTEDDILKEIAKNHEGILRHYLHESLTEKELKRNHDRLKKLVLLDKVIRTTFYGLVLWYAARWLQLDDTVARGYHYLQTISSH